MLNYLLVSVLTADVHPGLLRETKTEVTKVLGKINDFLLEIM